ncbi:MAG: hypothetical protein ACJ76Z_09215 [Thermoleophilaceae bacterium]
MFVPRHRAVAVRIALGALTAVALVAAPARADVGAVAAKEGLGAPPLASNACSDATYPDCRRLRFAYGPLTVEPGANQQLLGLNIAKPMYDGYVTRLSANLYRTDGSVPPVDVVHLHHGAWVSSPSYGNFPVFFATGEEKTHFQLPPGYGMKVAGSDQWTLSYMLHNLTPVAEHVYVVYDLDYVPAQQAEAQGIAAAKPLWLDVQSRTYPFYPVFNVQRGFGHFDPKFGRKVCTFPKERCAAFDPFGESQPANGVGWDYTVPAEYAGTLVALGGHLHPGGLEDQVSLVRGGAERRIFNSDADYFDPAGPVSWDMAMTVAPPDWRVRVQPGDKLRLNAVYDSQAASWYEDMGIVMAWIAPGDQTGVDPFAPGASVQTEGQVTHGHLPENDNHGGVGSRPLPRRAGAITSRIRIKGFIYRPGDVATIRAIPRVRANRRVTFVNGDSSREIWHTFTTCRAPCTASTGIAYPLANAMPAMDSLELGTTSFPGFQAASGKRSFSLTPRKAGLRPGHVYTYFCRIHPFMRGAFKVVR